MMKMKKEVYSFVLASVVLGASSIAFAGAYGEAEQPEEIPAPAPAAAPEPEPAPAVMRKFSGFITDAETTRGLRVEVGTMYAAEYHPSRVGDVEATNTYGLVSYGQEQWEVGLYLPPYRWVDQEGTGSDDDGDFGDLRVWGKYLPVRTENFTFGGGLIISFPTGDDGMGTALYGFEPYLTSAVQVGVASIRYSVGYDVYTKHDNLPDNVYDNLDNNLAVLAPVVENLVVRVEMTHNHFANNDNDPVSIFPGVDYTIGIGSTELVLRPTLGIGITEAPDWQIGLGIALNAPGI
jgi:hypothetical protein